MRQVLVTGAGGFIGRALCEGMQAWGWRVRGTVRNSKHVGNLPVGIDAIQLESIGPDTNWSKALNGVDTVVHLAARTHIMNDTVPDPLSEYRYVNVAGTEHLVRTAAAMGCRRFIFMSSVKVNGEGRFQPYTEKDIPAPLDPYGLSKWEAEQVLQEIANETGMEVVVLRSPVVYGPWVKANFLRLVKWVYRGIPLPLSLVKNRRSLIYLGNLVDAIVTCITHPGATGQTYVVSDGEDVSTPELIRRIANALGKPVRLFPLPTFLLKTIGRIIRKSAEVERLIGSLTVDVSKIRNELNWKAPYTMEQGLFETAKWYKKRGREVQSTDYADYTD